MDYDTDTLVAMFLISGNIFGGLMLASLVVGIVIGLLGWCDKLIFDPTKGGLVTSEWRLTVVIVNLWVCICSWAILMMHIFAALAYVD